MLTQWKQQGHHHILSLAAFTLGNVMDFTRIALPQIFRSSSTEHPGKRNSFCAHSLEAFQHAWLGEKSSQKLQLHQLMWWWLPDPVQSDLGERARCTRNQLRRGHGMLVRAGCPLHCRAQLLGHCPCHQPPNNIPSDDAPHSTVWFCCQSSQSKQIHDAVRDLSASKLLCDQEERVQWSGVAQERAQMLHGHSRRAGGGTPSWWTQVSAELGFIQLESSRGNEIGQLCWHRFAGVRRSTDLISESIQRGLVPWGKIGSFQHLPGMRQLANLHECLRTNGTLLNIVFTPPQTAAPRLGCPLVTRDACFNQVEPFPLENASNRDVNLLREMWPPPGGRWRSIRGNIMSTFHPLSCRTSWSLANTFSRANFIAFLKGPRRNRGTLFITAARWQKISTTFTRSMASDDVRNCGALGGSTSATSTRRLTASSVSPGVEVSMFTVSSSSKGMWSGGNVGGGAGGPTSANSARSTMWGGWTSLRWPNLLESNRTPTHRKRSLGQRGCGGLWHAMQIPWS